MRPDVEASVYHEHSQARKNFNKTELKRCRFMLRRLRFLETKVRQTGGMADRTGNGGSAFAEWEMEAIEWLLTEIGFLADPKIGESA